MSNVQENRSERGDFPARDFEALRERFCARGYDVIFPMFAKIDVNGVNTHPLCQYLKLEKPGIPGTEAIT